MATKTVTLNGAEQRVDELGGLNALIVNNTTEVLYASAKAGVVPYADGVVEIKAGDMRTVLDTNGTVYLLGNGGRVELTGGINFNQPSRSSGGGGGVTLAEVNSIVTEKIAEVVANAPEDLDTLKEIADWIEGHEDSAAAMNSAIQTNATDISEIQTEQETQDSDISALQAEMAQKADISEVSNPNLLDNPDFKINQRGKNEYVGKQYTVDRWFNFHPCTATVTSEGIQLTRVNNQGFCQFIENPERFAGQKLTFSVCDKADGGYAHRQIIADGVGISNNIVGLSEDFTIKSTSFVVPDNISTMMVAFSGEGTSTIKWAKLELGDRATPFIPPNPTLELLKCQRYYVEFNPDGKQYACVGQGVGNTISRATIYVPIPVKMRANPTLYYYGNWCLSKDLLVDNDKPVSQIAFHNDNDSLNYILLIANASEVIVGEQYFLRASGDTSAKLSFSADL